MTHRKLLTLESKEEKKPEAKPLDRDWTIPLDPPGILSLAVREYCTEDDASTLAASSHQFYAISQYRRAYEAATKKLLQLTANPSKENLEIAEAMIKQNYRLILQPMPFTEELCGQREWKAPISSLEYTAWAGDTPLRRIYLEHLPTGSYPEALCQLTQMQKNGTEHGKPLSVIYQLIDAYKTYNKLYKKYTYTEKHLNERRHHWVHCIGKNQLNSVVNLIQWYCSAYPFVPLPDFNQTPDRAPLLIAPNFLGLAIRSEYQTSLSLARDSSLGTSFSLCKSQRPGAILYNNPHYFSLKDLAAITHFCKVRTKDLIKDISQLQQPELKQDHLEQVEEKSRCLVM